jgi:hypothetical protein
VAPKSRIDLTGDKALTAALREFPAKFTNKAMRRILRDTIKTVVQVDYRDNVARGETRQLAKTRIRAIPRSRNKIGSRMLVEAAHASFVILGTKFIKATRTMQTALFDNASMIKMRITVAARAALPAIAAEVRAKTKKRG